MGLYPTGALINHSRDFTAVQSFDGAAVRFSAVRPIAAGEEITISYLDLKCTRPGGETAFAILWETHFSTTHTQCGLARHHPRRKTLRPF